MSTERASSPASYTIIEIVRQVTKRRDTRDITCPPSQTASVLEESYADVSLLAGMLVDKFRYHLSLYRQHQRVKAAGITLSPAPLCHRCTPSTALQRLKGVLVSHEIWQRGRGHLGGKAFAFGGISCARHHSM